MDKKNSVPIFAILKGVMIGIALSFALSFIASILVSGETVTMDMLSWIAPVINFISTLIGCAIAARKEKGMLAILCGGICGGYLLIMVLTGLAAYGKLGSTWWYGALASVIGGVCVSFISARKPVKTRRYR